MSGLAEAIGARNLKIAIVTMPLFFIAALALIILIFGNKDEEAPAETAAAVEGAALSATQNAERVAIGAGAAPSGLALDGDRLAVRIDGPDGVEVVVYDLAKGEVIARIEFAPE